MRFVHFITIDDQGTPQRDIYVNPELVRYVTAMQPYGKNDRSKVTFAMDDSILIGMTAEDAQRKLQSSLTPLRVVETPKPAAVVETSKPAIVVEASKPAAAVETAKPGAAVEAAPAPGETPKLTPKLAPRPAPKLAPIP